MSEPPLPEPSGSPPEGSAPPRPPWASFRAALEELGFHPSRRLGQNFLLDENLVGAIARDADLPPDAFVLEVGPGCGFLSVHLAARGARLLAVEIDSRLAEVSERFLASYPKATVLRADVLAGKHRLAPEVEERLPEEGGMHLVSNLPYSVSAPLLAVLATRPKPPLSMTVLVQKEVGERMLARPRTPDWGPLSIVLQLAYTGSILRSVGPAAFWPRPRVDSLLVRLERRPDRRPAAERARIVELVRRLMTRRRQTLGRVLGDELGRRRAADILAELGLDPLRRAETLSLAEWEDLDERVGGA